VVTGPSGVEAPAATPAAAPKIKTFAELMAEKYASADAALGVPSQEAKELNVHVPDEALKRARARQELWQRSKQAAVPPVHAASGRTARSPHMYMRRRTDRCVSTLPLEIECSCVRAETAAAAAAAAAAENSAATLTAPSAAPTDGTVEKRLAKPSAVVAHSPAAPAVMGTHRAGAKTHPSVVQRAAGSNESAASAGPAEATATAAQPPSATAEAEVGVVKPMRVKSAGETVEVTYRVHVPEGRLKELQERKRRQDERGAAFSHACVRASVHSSGPSHGGPPLFVGYSESPRSPLCCSCALCAYLWR
jgi:hypothetical protein